MAEYSDTDKELSENIISESADDIDFQPPDDIPEDTATVEMEDEDGDVDDIPEDTIPPDIESTSESPKITEGNFEIDGDDVHFVVDETALAEEETAEWAQLEENTPEVPNDSVNMSNQPLNESSDWTEEDTQLYENDFGAVNEDTLDYSSQEYMDTGKLKPDWGPDSNEDAEIITLPQGTRLVQYSHPGSSGKYFALEGTDYEDLQLPDSEDKRVQEYFEVPEGGLTVSKSKIAVQPWNKKEGSGEDTGALQFTSAEQYGENGEVIAENADQLVEQGKLKRIDKSDDRSDADVLDKSSDVSRNLIDIEAKETAKDTPQDSTEIQDIDDIQSWLGDINPNFDEFDPESPYCNNCGSCAYSVYRRLEGDTEIQATDKNIGDIETMNSMTDMEQVPMSPEEIESKLLDQGNGAHAIIGIDRAEGSGHWFNAAVVNGKVVAIDGQTGTISDWPPDYGDVVRWDMSVKKGK